ncbi:MAG: penicillin-insensitive murein endopeptidase [Inquilinus sp.]|nr:penicillin-insensitive murein endopeptidase [Inquilinus sp.]
MVFAVLLLGDSAAAQEIAWNAIRSPAPGEPNAIGAYANGCLLGAEELPPEGAGYQAIRLSRHRNYGHPELVQFIIDLGARLDEVGIGPVLIADMAQPRGGPMPSGHISHQSGLDADIWFRLDLPRLPRSARDFVPAEIMVDRGDWRLRTEVWTDAQATILHLAATDPRIARIFVHPVLKRDMCEREWEDRTFLRTLRPWFGHDAHFHVRLQCPDDNPDCQPQNSIPPGEGCGEELLSWFPEPGEPPPRPRPSQRVPPTPSETCVAVATME